MTIINKQLLITGNIMQKRPCFKFVFVIIFIPLNVETMNLPEIQKYLKRFTIGIAGAGGLGSHCAAALVRTGIGGLVLADYDLVEKQNLDRQYYFNDQVGMMKTVALKENLERISSETRIIIHQKKLDRTNIPLIFSGCDIIVEAFDSALMKQMIVETVQSTMPGIPLVVASGVAGWSMDDQLKYRKIDDCLFVCGDESSEASEETPFLAPRVGIVANMQANVVINILLRKSEPRTHENHAQQPGGRI